MTFYIQYDEQGNITGTMNDGGNTSLPPPNHPRQLVVAEGWVPTLGKKVDLETMELIDDTGI